MAMTDGAFLFRLSQVEHTHSEELLWTLINHPLFPLLHLHQLPPFHSQHHVFSGPLRKQMRLSAWQDEKKAQRDGSLPLQAVWRESRCLESSLLAPFLPQPQSVFSAACKGCPPQTEAWVPLGAKGKRTSVPKGPQGSCLPVSVTSATAGNLMYPRPS